MIKIMGLGAGCYVCNSMEGSSAAELPFPFDYCFHGISFSIFYSQSVCIFICWGCFVKIYIYISCSCIIYLNKVCLLIRVFSTFTLKVITEIVGYNSILFAINLCHVFLYSSFLAFFLLMKYFYFI